MSQKPDISYHIQDPTLLSLLQEQCLAQQWGEGNEGITVTDAGKEADIILTPPIRLGEVLDRIEQAHHHRKRRPSEIVSLGHHVRLNAQDRLLNLPGTPAIALTDTEVDILLALHRAEGEAIDRQTLMTDILGYHAEAETHTVETHIYRLRQKLDPVPALADLIITEKGAYRLWNAERE